jgi:hypothetical protein
MTTSCAPWATHSWGAVHEPAGWGRTDQHGYFAQPGGRSRGPRPNDSDNDDDETVNETNEGGPWALVITASGLGKRVPVSKFRLQNRAGMGLMAIKFRKEDDTLVALLIANKGDELMLITNRGIIIRQRVNDISIQSRPATGVRLQRLDDEDAIAAVALVPPALQEEDDEMESGEAESSTTDEQANTEVLDEGINDGLYNEDAVNEEE